MGSSDDSQIVPSESGVYPPIYGRKSKTATRGGKKESTRSGSVSAPGNLVQPKDQDADLASSTNVSSDYAIGNLGERTDLGEIPATQLYSKVLSIRTAKSDNFTRGEDEGHHGSTDKSTGGDLSPNASHGNQISGDKHEDEQFQNDDSQRIAADGSSGKHQGHQGSEDEHEIGQRQNDASKHEDDVQSASSYQGDQGTMQEYSAESRVYHAYYDEVGASTHKYFGRPANSSSSNELISEAITPGVVSTAWNCSLNLGFHFGPASRPCSCSLP
jgi:hypothetical protein